MNQALIDRCDLLVKNNETLNSAFLLQMNILNLAGASLFTCENMTAEKESLKNCHKILKSKTNIFSTFRGHAQVPLLCKMNLSENPEVYFEQVEKVYDMFMKNHILADEYKVLAAMTVVDHVEENEYQSLVDRTNEIYRRMKENHKFLTSHEDIPVATILALSKKDIDELIQDMEECYEILRGEFFDNDAVQSLTHVLALYDTKPQEKCGRVLTLFKALKKAGHKFGSGHELACLGTVAALSLSDEQIVQEISYMDDYLHEFKGFGNLALGSKERRLYAAQMVLCEYGKDSFNKESAVLTSAIAVAIAIEICIMLCIIASSTAAHAHSSH